MSARTADHLRSINAVLLKLSNDEDFQDDLKLPIVKAAIDHWTGKNRLDTEKAQVLQNNRRVVYVLQRFQMLQSVCREAQMSVPLDHLLLGKQELDSGLVSQYFPILNKEKKSTTKPQYNNNTTTTTKEPGSQVKETIPIVPEQPSSSNISNVSSSEDTKKTVTQIKMSNSNSDVDINNIIKLAIAVTMVLIAITLSYLFTR